jgi:F0F1-type ATP synthase assembly protein I
MRKFRIVLAFVAAAILIGMLFTIDFDKFLSKSNLGSFLGILAMILVILNMILSNRHEAKNKKK